MIKSQLNDEDIPFPVATKNHDGSYFVSQGYVGRTYDGRIVYIGTHYCKVRKDCYDMCNEAVMLTQESAVICAEQYRLLKQYDLI